MIKAIIFDCFGVLMTEDWLNFADKYFGRGTELREKAKELMNQVNHGTINYSEFVREVAGLANVDVQTVSQKIMSNSPNEQLLDYIRKNLRSKYKLAILSNTGRELGDLFASDQLELFDEHILSFETGYAKPEPKAYELAANRLNVLPEECVFVDDQEKCCVAARSVGMRAILYQNFDDFEPDLENILN